MNSKITQSYEYINGDMWGKQYSIFLSDSDIFRLLSIIPEQEKHKLDSLMGGDNIYEKLAGLAMIFYYLEQEQQILTSIILERNNEQ